MDIWNNSGYMEYIRISEHKEYIWIFGYMKYIYGYLETLGGMIVLYLCSQLAVHLQLFTNTDIL